uniref:Uncharacterized protein n=1 Tax=Mycena chlorophos TaxID=658473 RepID=A0ABQ0MB81_MYCCL|nr:predicted protein [Mycena chlorophos]
MASSVCLNGICSPQLEAPQPSSNRQVHEGRMQIGDIRVLPQAIPLHAARLANFLVQADESDALSEDTRSYLVGVSDDWRRRLERQQAGRLAVYVFFLATFGGCPQWQLATDARRAIVEVHQCAGDLRVKDGYFEDRVHVHSIPEHKNAKARKGRHQYLLVEEYGPIILEAGQVLPRYLTSTQPAGTYLPSPTVNNLLERWDVLRRELQQTIQDDPALVKQTGHLFSVSRFHAFLGGLMLFQNDIKAKRAASLRQKRRTGDENSRSLSSPRYAPSTPNHGSSRRQRRFAAKPATQASSRLQNVSNAANMKSFAKRLA